MDNLSNVELVFSPEMDKSKGNFSPEMDKSKRNFSPEMDKSSDNLNNKDINNSNKNDNQLINSKRTYSKISKDKNDNNSIKISQVNESNNNKKLKYSNNLIDIDCDSINTNLINQNLDENFNLNKNFDNINEQIVTSQIKNANHNKENISKKSKILEPIDIKINDDKKYDTKLFELTNKLILISNKLVDSKAKRKLSLEDKSNISNEIRDITEQMYKINIENVDRLVNKEINRNTSEDRINSNTLSNCNELINSNKQNKIKRNTESIQKRLRCTCFVKIKENNDFTELKDKISESEDFKNGSINIDYLSCDSKGIVKINCETPLGCSILMKYLESFGHKPYKRITNKFLYCIHGIPLNYKNENIINELCKRDKRFEDKTLFSINKRFKLDKSHDTIVIQILDPLADKIEKNPVTYLGFKKYKIKKFYNIVQCFKCAKFGHTAIECKSDCDSAYCRGCEECAKCANCAGSHNLDKCSKNFTPKCINCEREGYCDTNHASWYVCCPVRRKYIEEMKTNDNG